MSVLHEGFWQLAIPATAVVAVTGIALLRAPRGDVAKVYASFARGFGFHGRGGADAEEEPEDIPSSKRLESAQNEMDSAVEEGQ
ncbi:hypothetical protein ACFXHA_43100 [Nocardia sp. NPDC059240]|uniref:hypothetical protein n=1 Tax=Nocardia sp. NPDC059240 TaxID=3346786 RepID=UPI003680A203